jgi:hypothetical protein
MIRLLFSCFSSLPYYLLMLVAAPLTIYLPSQVGIFFGYFLIVYVASVWQVAVENLVTHTTPQRALTISGFVYLLEVSSCFFQFFLHSDTLPNDLLFRYWLLFGLLLIILYQYLVLKCVREQINFSSFVLHC